MQCKLEYQSCITGKKIVAKCPGMCPCPAQPEPSSAERKGSRLCAPRAALSHAARLKRLQIVCSYQAENFIFTRLLLAAAEVLVTFSNPHTLSGVYGGKEFCPRPVLNRPGGAAISLKISTLVQCFQPQCSRLASALLSALTSKPGWICWTRACNATTTGH